MFSFNRKPQQTNPIDASVDTSVRTLSDTECRQVAQDLLLQHRR